MTGRQATLRAAVGLAAAFWLLAGPAAWGQAQKGNVKAGIESCNQTFTDADGDGKVIDGVLDNLEGLLEKGELQTADRGPEEPARQTAELVKAEPAKLPDRTVIAQARQARQWIKAYVQQGRAELEKAKRAKDPQVARVHLKAALLQADKVRTITRRLASALTPEGGSETPSAPGPRAGIDLTGPNAPLAQLKRMVKKTQRGGRKPAQATLGDVYEAWEGVAAKGFRSTQGTGFFQGQFEQKNGRIKLESGRTVDVRPLTQALRKVAPQAARKPLFREVPSPVGGRPELRLSPEALKAVHDPATRKKMVKVGGVELEVTFDLLSFAGVADLRGSGPAAVIELPILVSLGELYRRLKPYARSAARWNGLPDELRYPGGLERLHGYVLDPRTKDVFLVGARARARENRIDVDSLILGLRSVWADGDTPSVSLDPLPGDPGGPQYARIYNVPPDSVFAKIMLDADYAMKRIMAGHLKVNQPGYVSYADIRRRERSPELLGNRFWLHPTPLGWGNVHQSVTGRTVLVETRVQVLTEAEKQAAAGVVRAGGSSFSGQVYGPAKRAAENFTRFYDRFERAPEIQPKGIFMRLHGLLDVVTLAKFWRQARLDYPVLRKFARLPVRRLSVRAYYAGISVVLYKEVVRRTAEGEWVRRHTLSGGVRMRARASGGAVESYQDMVTDTLERAVETFSPRRGFARSVSLTFALPRAGDGGGTRMGELLELGMANLTRGEYAAARRQFAEVTRFDPFLTEAWVNLAIAESSLGNHRAALDAIDKALLQEPSNADLRRIAIALFVRADETADPSGWDPALRRDLSNEFTLVGLLAWVRDDKQAIENAAERALRLWEDNADGYFLRAQVREPMSRGWTRDIERAIRLYRKQMARDDRGRGRLALALAWRAQARRIDLGRRTDDRLLNDPGLQHLMLVADRAARDAAEAAQLSPRLGLAHSVEIELLTWRVGIFQAIGRPWDMSEILRRADRLAKNFPDFAPGHRARAYALGTADKVPAAVEAISRAIELNPKLQGALPERAGMRGMLRDCAGAREDIRRAHELDLFVHPELESFVRQCR